MALLFFIAMKSTYSAIRSAVAGRTGLFLDVIDAKHAAFKEKPEAERMPNMIAKELYQAIKKM